MKKLIIPIIMLFCAAAFAQNPPKTAVTAPAKQRIAVLPSVGDLEPQGLILLTDKVREIATKNLPMENFTILKQDIITKLIGEEELYRACKEGVCIGDLARKTDANYGARCDVIKFNNRLVLKFEIYSVNEDAIFETFTDYNVKDFYGMLAVLEKRLPSTFKKVVIAQNKALADARDKAIEQQRLEQQKMEQQKLELEKALADAGDRAIEQQRLEQQKMEQQKPELDKALADVKDKAEEPPQGGPDTTTTLADFRDESVGLDMVFVKGGAFMMGCTEERGCASDEKPPLRVTLSGFYIGKYEVTQKQWVQVMGSNPSYFNSDGDNLPVENVSWNDVQEFISKLDSITGKKYRLPTEAEWEYAARGRTNGGYKFSGGKFIDDVGWYRGNSVKENNRVRVGYEKPISIKKTSPVGGKRPNEIGLYDMTGNVAEWVSDYYDYRIYAFANITANPKGPVSGLYKTVRGGAYNNYTKKCRVFYRDSEKPDVRKSSVGFRLALDAPQDTGAAQLSQPQQEEGYAAKLQISRSMRGSESGFYFAPKYILPLGVPVGWGFNAEIGWTYKNRMFWGIDINFGLGVDSGSGLIGRRDGVLIGGGFSLGGVYDLPNNPQMQLAYGGGVGYWRAWKDNDYRYGDNRYAYHHYGGRDDHNFLAPFIRFRWKSFELSYRGLLGIYDEYGYRDDGTGGYYDDVGFSWNNNQIMLGLYFGGR